MLVVTKSIGMVRTEFSNNLPQTNAVQKYVKAIISQDIWA